MKTTKTYWKEIGDSGVLHHPEEANLIRPLNYILLFTALVLFLIGLLAFSSSLFIYSYIIFPTSFFYLLQIFLIKKGKLFLAKILMGTLPSIALFTCWVFVGGYFAQSIVIITVIAYIFILFRNNLKIRTFLIGFNLIGFSICAIFTSLNPPIFNIEDIFLDEIIIFSLSVSWIYFVFRFHHQEQQKLINTLQEKNKVLEITSNELEHFTHLASHDLKAPLRNINAYLSFLERNIKRKEYEKLAENINHAKKSTKQMQSLLEGMRDLSKVHLGKNDRIKKLDLNILLAKAVKNLQHSILSSNAKIKINSLPHFDCNEVEFSLLFQNLIQNGVKYNKQDEPKVEIWSEQKDGILSIFFKDNGIGIEEAYHEQIFEFFKRLHNSSEYEGSGMGLGLCYKIVQKYNGIIKVESEFGKGSTFILEFSLAKENTSAIAAKTAINTNTLGWNEL